jgi:hypothetical protein
MEAKELKELEAKCTKAREALSAIGAGDAIVISEQLWNQLVSELARLRQIAEALPRSNR